VTRITTGAAVGAGSVGGGSVGLGRLGATGAGDDSAGVTPGGGPLGGALRGTADKGGADGGALVGAAPGGGPLGGALRGGPAGGGELGGALDGPAEGGGELPGGPDGGGELGGALRGGLDGGADPVALNPGRDGVMVGPRGRGVGAPSGVGAPGVDGRAPIPGEDMGIPGVVPGGSIASFFGTPIAVTCCTSAMNPPRRAGSTGAAGSGATCAGSGAEAGVTFSPVHSRNAPHEPQNASASELLKPHFLQTIIDRRSTSRR
jgi:hypothetical protein